MKEFDWDAAGKGVLDVITNGISEYVDVTVPEVKAKLALLADEGTLYLQAKVAGDPLADRMLDVLVSTARLLGARHALAAQAKAERVAGQVVEKALGYLAVFLRGMIGVPGLPV